MKTRINLKTDVLWRIKRSSMVLRLLHGKNLPPKMVIVFVFISSLFACDNKIPSHQQSSASAVSDSKKTVNLAIWSNYITPEIIKEFEKQHSVRVQLSHYSSNEELLAKLQAGASDYDVIVPSDYMIGVMIKLNLLKQLEKSKILSFKELDPRYLGKNFDPPNQYSLPYDTGTTGIAINRTKYKGKLTSWSDLFHNKDLEGKFSVLDDMRETLGAALKSLGYSLNTRDKIQLQKAKSLLLEAKGRVRAFTSETLTPLVNGEWAVAHAYVSDALQARKASKGKIDYIIPEEGGTLWIDHLAVPRTAPHLNEAYLLLNFLLDAKTNASTATHIFVAPANKVAMSLIPKEILSIRSLFPSESEIKKSEMIEDLGDSLLEWDRVWTEVKATEVK